MKKTIFSLVALMFGVMGVQTLSAQTDVTAQYLTNAGFEGSATQLTQGNNNGMWQPEGWTLTYTNLDAAWDQSNLLNTELKATEGNKYFYVRIRWGNTTSVKLEQNLKNLPAGLYKLSASVHCPDDNTAKITFGSVSHTMAKTGGWQEVSILYYALTDQDVDFNVVVTRSSAAQQRLYIDNVRLTQIPLANISSENPVDMTTYGVSAPWTGNSGSYTAGSVKMVEHYKSQFWTGAVMSKNITGLPDGKYDMEFYAEASATGRSWESSVIAAANGATDYTVATANGMSVGIPVVNNQTGVSSCRYYKLEDVVVNNGTIAFSIENKKQGANWIISEVKSLTYKGPDLAIYEAAFDSYYETLATLSADAIPTVLVEKINDAKTTYASRPADMAGLEAANAQMNSLIMAYNEQTAPYARIKSLISTCEDIIEFSATETADVKSPFAAAVSQALADANAAISSAVLQDVYNTLEGKRQDYVKVAYPISGYSFDMTFMMSDAAVTDVSLWTNGRSGSGEAYTGAPDNTYLDIWNSTTDMYRTVTNLPEGDYSITVATRASADIADSYIYAQGDGEKIAATTHQVGNTGNTLDRGWDWTTINNVVVTKGNLVIGFYANAVNSKWAGADDFRLLRSYDATSIQNALSSLKVAAQKANVLPMGTEQSAALSAAVSVAEEKVSSTNPFELRAAIVGLEEAMKAAESWRVAYNEAKAPLVAALERFETDFNDGANGALQTMSAEAWAILLTKVQAAAEAKDATTDYSGFAAAASALTEQFDKTDYDRVVEKAQGMSSSLAVQSALAQFGDRNVILSGSSEQCAMAINVLNKAMTMAENQDAATSLWSNADFKGGTISHSVQGSGGKVNSPSGWNFAYNFDGWNDVFVNDGVFNVWAGTIRYAELSQTVGNIPNGTYKLSAYLDSDGDTQEGNSWVALYGAPKNGDVVRSCNVAGDTSTEYIAYVKVVDNELTVGVRTDARYFKIKNLSIQFVEDNVAETDKGRMYQHAFLRKDALEVDFTSFAAAQGVKVYMTQPNVIMTANEGQLTNEKNVVVNGVCEQLVLTDQSPLNISNEFAATSATYTRAMSNDWGTVILPYAVTSNEEVKYYELTEVTTGASDVMTFTLVDVLEASKPGAFKKQTGAAEVTLSANNAAVAVTTDTEGVSAVDGWTMTGSYTAQTIDVTQDASHTYYYISNDQFWHATGSLSINPFRACFKSLSASEVKNFMISLDGNQLTGIEEANPTANSLVVFGERGRLVMEAGRDVNYAVYTLSGQLVEQGTLRQGESRSVNVTAGIYVVNGAKVQVK